MMTLTGEDGAMTNLDMRVARAADAAFLVPDAQPAVSTLKNFAPQVAQLVGEARKKVHAYMANPDLTPEARQRLAGQARAEALAQLDKLERGAESAAERIRALVRRVTNAPTTTQEAILAELKHQRVWGRVQRVLDGQGDFAGMVQAATQQARAAAENSDLDTLRIMRGELPSYLASREMSSAWPAIDMALAELEAPLLPASEVAARRLLHLVDTSWPTVKFALYFVRQELEGREPASVMVGLDGETITISSELPAVSTWGYTG